MTKLLHTTQHQPTSGEADVGDVSGRGEGGDDDAVLGQVLGRGRQEHVLLAGPQAVGQYDLWHGVDPAVAVVHPQGALLTVTFLQIGVEKVLDVQVRSAARARSIDR